MYPGAIDRQSSTPLNLHKRQRTLQEFLLKETKCPHNAVFKIHTRYNCLYNTIFGVDKVPTGNSVTSTPTLSQNFQETNIVFRF